MKIDKAVYISVITSLSLHTVFLALSPRITLSGMHGVVDNTRRIFRLEGVRDKAKTVDLFGNTLSKTHPVKVTRDNGLFGDKDSEGVYMNEKPAADLLSETKKKEFENSAVKDVPTEHDSKLESDYLKKMENKKARDEAAPGTMDTVQKGSDTSMIEHESVLTTGANTSEGQPVISPSRISASGRDTEYPVDSTYHKNYSLLGDVVKNGNTAKGEYENISGKLGVDVLTYRDRNTGEKYFKIVINAKSGVKFRVMPKELVFVIDVSKSMTEEKFSMVKDAVISSLQNLNPDDKVNVDAFRGNITKFSERPVKVSAKTLNSIKGFVEGLHAEGQTDVGKSLFQIIGEKADMYPSYLVLITDGRPTVGMLDSRRIIQEVTRKNDMERPIFCFGGGRKVNRYLLDFISFQNRAWSRFFGDAYKIKDAFMPFFMEIKDPILVNVRYYISGLDEKEIYPKYLSDFYKEKPFVIYGRFGDEDVFSMQVIGETDDGTKEFMFTRSLKNAPEGGPDIARDWAFRKIYYLISRNTMAMGDGDVQAREILRLSKKYGIKTPYSSGTDNNE